MWEDGHWKHPESMAFNGFEATRERLVGALGGDGVVAEKPYPCDDAHTCAGHVGVSWKGGDTMEAMAAKVAAAVGGKVEKVNPLTCYVETSGGIVVELSHEHTPERIVAAVLRAYAHSTLHGLEKDAAYRIGYALGTLDAELTETEEIAARLCLDEQPIEDDRTGFLGITYVDAFMTPERALRLLELADSVRDTA